MSNNQHSRNQHRSHTFLVQTQLYNPVKASSKAIEYLNMKKTQSTDQQSFSEVNTPKTTKLNQTMSSPSKLISSRDHLRSKTLKYIDSLKQKSITRGVISELTCQRVCQKFINKLKLKIQRKKEWTNQVNFIPQSEITSLQNNQIQYVKQFQNLQHLLQQELDQQIKNPIIIQQQVNVQYKNLLKKAYSTNIGRIIQSQQCQQKRNYIKSDFSKFIGNIIQQTKDEINHQVSTRNVKNQLKKQLSQQLGQVIIGQQKKQTFESLKSQFSKCVEPIIKQQKQEIEKEYEVKGRKTLLKQQLSQKLGKVIEGQQCKQRLDNYKSSFSKVLDSIITSQQQELQQGLSAQEKKNILKKQLSQQINQLIQCNSRNQKLNRFKHEFSSTVDFIIKNQQQEIQVEYEQKNAIRERRTSLKTQFSPQLDQVIQSQHRINKLEYLKSSYSSSLRNIIDKQQIDQNKQQDEIIEQGVIEIQDNATIDNHKAIQMKLKKECSFKLNKVIQSQQTQTRQGLIKQQCSKFIPKIINNQQQQLQDQYIDLGDRTQIIQEQLQFVNQQFSINNLLQQFWMNQNEKLKLNLESQKAIQQKLKKECSFKLNKIIQSQQSNTRQELRKKECSKFLVNIIQDQQKTLNDTSDTILDHQNDVIQDIQLTNVRANQSKLKKEVSFKINKIIQTQQQMQRVEQIQKPDINIQQDPTNLQGQLQQYHQNEKLMRQFYLNQNISLNIIPDQPEPEKEQIQSEVKIELVNEQIQPESMIELAKEQIIQPEVKIELANEQHYQQNEHIIEQVKTEQSQDEEEIGNQQDLLQSQSNYSQSIAQDTKTTQQAQNNSLLKPSYSQYQKQDKVKKSVQFSQISQEAQASSLSLSLNQLDDVKLDLTALKKIEQDEKNKKKRGTKSTTSRKSNWSSKSVKEQAQDLAVPALSTALLGSAGIFLGKKLLEGNKKFLGIIPGLAVGAAIFYKKQLTQSQQILEEFGDDLNSDEGDYEQDQEQQEQEQQFN